MPFLCALSLPLCLLPAPGYLAGVGTQTAGAAARGSSCRLTSANPEIVATTPNGSVVTVNPRTLRVGPAVAQTVLGQDGVAYGPAFDVAFVTKEGPGGRPAIWSVPLAACHEASALVVPDAELPSVSPDGRYLGYVTLNGQGRQTGVAITDVDALGRRIGPTRRYRASSVPPPRPIQGLAIAPHDAAVAVWGGFVDPYLGRRRSTTGTLTPASVSTLDSLAPLFDGKGMTVPPPAPGKKFHEPELWQSAPLYLPNGDLLADFDDDYLAMPFSNATGSGGGFRDIIHKIGSISGLAAGTDGALAWIGAGDDLRVSYDAVELPLGPGADTPPTSTPPVHTVAGHYVSVAWTAGTSKAVTTPPPVFHFVAHLPSVVGMSEPAAAQVMKQLALPVIVRQTIDSSAPANTVVAQTPAAGDGVACQCAVRLFVAKA